MSRLLKILLFSYDMVVTADMGERVDESVKINRFWMPPECDRQVHKGDFVR